MFGAAAPVHAWQDSLRLPTYLESAADPSPQFSAFAPEGSSYPYPLRMNLTRNRGEQSWRVLHLENEYLLCRILPDLGGHLYSCRDKRNGREMFYANPVIKKVPFGLRGAFVALGIESNFPATHTRQTTSPVDFALHTEADGSARAIVEDIDLVTGMQWRVEYVLRPGSTVLEQRVTLYNRSLARRPYLWWANAGFALDDPGTRFVLPARLVADHGVARMDTWPVNAAGIDESVAANHKIAMSWFAFGSRETFFAVYKPGFRSGFAHFADPASVTGKKVWLWGSDQEATIRDQVTDNFPVYGELQAGLFENQETYAFLEPEQSRRFLRVLDPCPRSGRRIPRHPGCDCESGARGHGNTGARNQCHASHRQRSSSGCPARARLPSKRTPIWIRRCATNTFCRMPRPPLLH